MTKILIIDDDKAVAEMLRDSLGLHGYEAQTAHSGKQGLEKARKFLPDIITLDLEMPGMSGFEVLALLKNDKHTRDIPVFILTVRDEEDCRKKGFFFGIKEYMVKPFSISNLMEAIASYTDYAPSVN
jgi:two-component system OmpR family response regulator